MKCPHIIRRLRQRYPEIEWEWQDVENIKTMILAPPSNLKEAYFIYKLKDKKNIWKINYKGVEVYVIFNHLLGKVCTALTKKMVDSYKSNNEFLIFEGKTKDILRVKRFGLSNQR